MTPEQMERLEALFDHACGLSPEQRPAFIAAADTALRDQLRALLAADKVDATPLDAPAFEGAGAALSPEPTLQPCFPEQIGHYRVLRLLGEGGMGVVYEAEQDNPRRRVALKLLRPGLASPQALRRFELEAQLLGRLRHPGVAHIYEAGTVEMRLNGFPTRQPFLAMEFVDGEPITQYADRLKLDVRQRLALVADVCDAVHHAHQRGIIHRDLKPGNILVVDEGVEGKDQPLSSPSAPRSLGPLAPQPKVLDFGVARVRDTDDASAAAYTAVGQIVGTLPYMSPEQLGGDPAELDVRSDVYALGVVLYEMLCGRLPHTSSSPLELASQIREREPPRLSALRPALRGDVEAIVSKTLEKDRARRYQSVAELGQDLRRYLANEPIEARRASGFYVLRKAVARHRFAAAILMALALVVSGSAVALGLLYRQAQRQKDAADARAEDLRRSSYFNTIALAQAALDDRNTLALARRLEDCPADLRNWEWRYLARRSDDSLRAWPAHNGGAGVVFSPDNARLLTWSFDRTLRLWDAATGQLLRTVATLPVMFESAAFSPDGTRVIIGNRASTVAYWEPYGDAPPIALPAHESWVLRVAFAPDGRTFASSGLDGAICIFDAATGQLVRKFSACPEGTQGLAYSPDSRWLASSGWDGVIKLWDAETAALLAAWRGHSNRAVMVAFTPDGERLLSVGWDHRVRLWELPDGRLAREWDSGIDRTNHLAVSPDGTRVAVAASAAIRVWNLATGLEESPRLGHQRSILGLAFSPDGLRLASCDEKGEVRLWDAMPRHEPLTLRGHTNYVRGVAVSPDGRRIASASRDKTVRIWDAASGRELFKLIGHEQWVKGVAFTPDGRRLLSGGYDGTLRLWDAATGRLLNTLKSHSAQVRAVAIAPPGRWAAAACGDGTVELWDIDAQPEPAAPRLLSGHKNLVTSVAFSLDGTRLVSGGEDALVLLWDVPTGRRLREFINPDVRPVAVALSPDGRWIASGGSDLLVHLWDAQTGELCRTLAGHRGIVQSVAFSPDGTRLVSGCFGHLLHVWDVPSGKLTLALQGHQGGIPALAFSPDGRYFVSGSNDTTIKIWAAALPPDHPRDLQPMMP